MSAAETRTRTSLTSRIPTWTTSPALRSRSEIRDGDQTSTALLPSTAPNRALHRLHIPPTPPRPHLHRHPPPVSLLSQHVRRPPVRLRNAWNHEIRLADVIVRDQPPRPAKR